MAYDGRVMRVAMEKYLADKQRRSAQFLERKRRIFRQIPELQDIDIELRSTMSQIISSALQKGRDPLPAIRVIRDNNLDLQRRRAQLLEGSGYPADYLEEKPRCSYCGDTGYRNGDVCSCLQSYYAREQIKELSKMLDLGTQSFDTFSFEWYSNRVLPQVETSPRKQMESNFDVCRDYADAFGQQSGNLLFSGDPGLGKTFLSACIARVVSEDGFSVVYDTASHIFSQYEQAKFHRDDDMTAEGDVNRYQNCDLLIIDDLGTEMPGQFVTASLYALLNDRLLENRPMLVSTNLNIDELARRYSAQIASRLEGSFQRLTFVGEDIRVLKNRGI